MKDMKIVFSDDVRDFGSWMKEKSENILSGLCLAIEDEPQIIQNTGFLFALDDALKIFALTHGSLNGIHCDLVNQLLLNYHSVGYDFLKDLLNHTSNGTLMKQIMCWKYDGEILSLIEQNDKLNRSEIARLLAQIESPNQWTHKIADDIECVHSGEKDWAWFYNLHANDRSESVLCFEDTFIKQVYDYFNSEQFINAD